METKNNNNIAIAEEVVRKVLSYLDDQKINISVEEDTLTRTPRIHVVVSDPSVFIGQNGANLSAITHIVKKAVEQALISENSREGTRFILDVNDYQKKKTEALKEKVAILVDRARAFKNDVELDPMSSYERMIVHSLLADTGDISTESEGEGRSRRVVIKYTEKG
ncbi:MAG TPA: hypothetical protein ENI63_02110 [Candidatus Kaiserbacteria bacterium]|nr:hypothetical protein [Candidatus Kaiserbacteria bacterium]